MESDARKSSDQEPPDEFSENKDDLIKNEEEKSLAYYDRFSNSPSRSVAFYRGFGDSSFEESIRPRSPSQISRLENVENIVNKDGERITTVRSMKEVHGICPQIGTEAYGRQIRETSETTGAGVKAFKDIKTESIIGEDGTKITRTSQTKVTRTSYGRANLGSVKIPQSSFFTNYKFDEHMLGYGEVLKKSIDEAHTNEAHNSKRIKQSSFFTNFNIEDMNLESSSSRENIPVFVPFVTHKYEDENRSSINPRSTVSSTSSLSSYYTEEPKYEDNSSASKSYTTRFKSPFRSVPTIKEIVPPTFSYEIENYTVKKGDNALFKGTVNGSYPFEVKWYLDSDELTPSSRIEMTVKQDCSETFLTGLIDYIVSLKILKCTHQDIGKYTVFVKNEAGDATCSAFLIIEGKK